MNVNSLFYKRIGPPVVLMLFALLGGSPAASASTPAPCNVRLVVELTPDVPDPQDAGFLSSLLSNHPGYELRWVRRSSESAVVLDLTGPGPAEQCRGVMQTMGNDGRVLSLYGEEMQTVSVTEYRLPPAGRVSRTGLGSFLWAAHHPTQAWKIVLPLRPGDPAGPYADLVRACLITRTSTGASTACP